MFLACQDARFILCVFTFFEGVARLGHRFAPLGWRVLDYWKGWVGFKGDDIQEQFWGNNTILGIHFSELDIYKQMRVYISSELKCGDSSLKHAHVKCLASDIACVT